MDRDSSIYYYGLQLRFFTFDWAVSAITSCWMCNSVLGLNFEYETGKNSAGTVSVPSISFPLVYRLSESDSWGSELWDSFFLVNTRNLVTSLFRPIGDSKQALDVSVSLCVPCSGLQTCPGCFLCFHPLCEFGTGTDRQTALKGTLETLMAESSLQANAHRVSLCSHPLTS